MNTLTVLLLSAAAASPTDALPALPSSLRADDPAPEASDGGSAPASEAPSLKLRLGYQLVSYQYAQSPNLENQASVENDISSATVDEDARLIHGATAAARLWLPSRPAIGLDTQARGSFYSLDPAPICDSIGAPCPDQETISEAVFYGHLLALARYRFGPDSLPVYVGARFGLALTDFQITTEEDGVTGSRSALVMATGVGAELGAELSETLSLTVAYTHHIADYLKTPYGGQLELDVAYSLSDSLFLGLGAERIHRDMDITNQGDLQLGLINDTSLGGRVYLGLQR